MVETLWSGFEKQYNLDGYTVKEWDTSFSILNWMLKEEWISVKYKSKISKLVHKYKELSNIKVWDKFSLLEQDDNQIQITYNSGKWEKVYNINLLNNTIISLEDKQKEVIDKSKWWLDNLKQWILKELTENLNPELENIRNDVIKFLSSDKFTLEDNNTIIGYQNKLYLPECRNNKIAIEYRKVIDVLALLVDVKVEDAVYTISKIFEDKNITKSTKLRLAKYIRENFSWYLSNFWKWIEIINKLTEKFPNYKFDNYVMVSDPEWWEPIYTNIK